MGGTPYRGLRDDQLVELVAQQDAGALEALYDRYGRPAYSLARRILTEETLAQDVVQEVFLSLWRDAGRFDAGRGTVATYLLSMTHHRAVDVVRREEKLRRWRTSDEGLELEADPRPGSRTRSRRPSAGPRSGRPSRTCPRPSARPSCWPTSAATPSGRSRPWSGCRWAR